MEANQVQLNQLIDGQLIGKGKVKYMLFLVTKKCKAYMYLLVKVGYGGVGFVDVIQVHKDSWMNEVGQRFHTVPESSPLALRSPFNTKDNVNYQE